MNLKQAEPLVREILSASEKARNYDMELQRLALEKQGFILTPEQAKICPRLFNFETVRRTRQDLQHRGLYKANKQTKLKRDMAAEAQQIFFRNEKLANYDTPVSNEEVTKNMIGLIDFMRQRGITAEVLRNTRIK